MTREFNSLFLTEQVAGEGIAVTLEGPTTGYQTQSLTYVITNYDSYSIYEVQGPFNSIVMNNETINLAVNRNAPTGVVPFTVSKNGIARVLNLTIQEAYILAPTLIGLPGSTVSNVRPTFTVSGFDSSPAGISTHTATEWEIATDVTFQNLIWSKSTNSGNLNSVTVDIDLPTDTPLFLRMRFVGTVLGVGRWSMIKAFEVEGVVKPTVSLTSTIVSGDRISRNFTIRGTAYNGPGTHTASRWRLLDTQGNVVMDSGEVSGSRLLNYTPMNEGFTPLPNTDYYVDVRYKSSTGIWSRVSDPVSVLVADGRVTNYLTYYTEQVSSSYTEMRVICEPKNPPDYWLCFFDNALDRATSFPCDPNNPPPDAGVDPDYGLTLYYSYALPRPLICETRPVVRWTYSNRSTSRLTSRYTEF